MNHCVYTQGGHIVYTVSFRSRLKASFAPARACSRARSRLVLTSRGSRKKHATSQAFRPVSACGRRPVAWWEEKGTETPRGKRAAARNTCIRSHGTGLSLLSLGRATVRTLRYACEPLSSRGEQLYTARRENAKRRTHAYLRARASMSANESFTRDRTDRQTLERRGELKESSFEHRAVIVKQQKQKQRSPRSCG